MKNINNHKKPIEIVIYSKTSKKTEHQEKIRNLEKVLKERGARQDKSKKSPGVRVYDTSLCGIVIDYDSIKEDSLSPQYKYNIKVSLRGKYLLGNYSGKRGSCLKVSKKILKILEK